jgi:preprotein translocase subunit SecD
MRTITFALALSTVVGCGRKEPEIKSLVPPRTKVTFRVAHTEPFPGAVETPVPEGRAPFNERTFKPHKTLFIDPDDALTGADIVGTTPRQEKEDPDFGFVDIFLDKEGTERLKAVWEANEGRMLATFLDGEFELAAVIHGKSPGAAFQLSGKYNAEQTKKLALRFAGH